MQARQRVAVDPLHHEVEHVVLLAEVEDVGDVLVVDQRGDARLVEEHPLEARVVGQAWEDRLDRDELLEAALADLARDPHRRHAPLADGGEHLVAIDPEARRQRDRRRSIHPALESTAPRGPRPTSP
jgi:hypothetical protein